MIRMTGSEQARDRAGARTARTRPTKSFQTRLMELDARLIAAADITRFALERLTTDPTLDPPPEAAVRAEEAARKAVTLVLAAAAEAATALLLATRTTTDAAEGAEKAP